ncbi:MAG: AAA family ATPase [Nitrospira sp.]|nr:AAA family ATPase [Nitrospira sp.]
MRFHFENIGPIKKAELELGDLTIIAGRNNTGKTYLVYTLYGFLKGAASEMIVPAVVGGKAPFQSVDIKQVGKRLREEGQYKCPITPDALNKERNAVISMLARQFSEGGIADVFSSSPGNFQRSSIKVTLDDSDCDVGGGDSLQFAIGGENISIRYDGRNLVFSARPFEKSSSQSHIDGFVSFSYMQFLCMRFPTPFILSDERLGIPLFYKELDFTKNRLVEILQNMGTEKDRDSVSPYMFLDKHASRYALPIKHNIDYTRSIPDLVKGKGPMQDAKLDDDVETIMGGYYQSDETGIRFVSSSREDTRFNIPLHLASSSARGLSDLYFYLCHKAKKNHLLIIDEPESHLDTRNQIMLARMLARWVHAGIKVLITTHSDYILKEINNLVMLSSEFEGKEKFLEEHHEYAKREFLRRESLRGYVAEDGQLTRCRVDKFGFDMPVFDKTINDINAVSSELDSRLDDTEEE